jgi:membrane peptidoglycan carboxypeptidase
MGLPMSTLWRSFRGFVITVVLGGIAVGACLAALIPGATTLFNSNQYSTPAISNLSKLDQRSTVFDSAGNQLAQLGIQNREVVPLSAVPKVVINAVVATEDKTFWHNDGIDIASVFRAALKNFTSGKIEQGGSTITQQLVKNRILTSKRDLNRKIKEIMLALRLNKVYSKNEILEQYLNTVYFGQGSYGVKTAVERFFLTGTPPFLVPEQLSQVTLGQAALLAGLISNPEGNNPFVYPDRAKARRSFVLDQMVKQKYATPAQAAVANTEPLPSIKPGSSLQPHDAWTQQVQDSLIQDPRYAAALGATPQARTDALLKGGLKIYATLDQNAQNNAQNAVNAVLRSSGRSGFTSSLVAMDPNTGAVKAMIPGPDFAVNQYNIATHPPGRQMGSTWKVVTLAAALTAGFSPNDSVSGASPCAFKGGLGQTQNAEAGGGVMSIRSATQNSVNCAFARIELAVGIPNVVDMAKKMGFTQNPANLLPVLTLTLGTITATPLEMATYMSTVASGGIHHTPYFVSKIVGPDGNTIFEQSPAGDRVLSQDVADCEVSLLRGVVTGGTGTKAQTPDGRPEFGKTGTTDDKKNAAFYGGTYGQLVAFVWYGDKDANVPGAGFGGDIPATIWRTFMTAQLAGQPVAPLPPPGPVCSRPGSAIDDSGARHSGQSSGIDSSGNPLVPTTPPPTVQVNPITTTTAPAATTAPTTAPAATTAPPAPPGGPGH